MFSRIIKYGFVGTAGVISFVFIADEVEKRSRRITNTSRKKKVVVLGSGWAALSFIQQIDESVVDLKVVSPRSFFFYTPLLAGSATGTVAHSSIMEPMRWHTSRFGPSSFIMAECQSVDFYAGMVTCVGEGGNEIELEYDHLIIAIGAEPATFNIPGVKEHAVFMKEVENGLQVQKRVLHQLEHASALMSKNVTDPEIDRALHWVVVGGGPTGVELTAELSDFVNSDVKRYFPHLYDRVRITLVEATDKILGTFAGDISQYAKTSLIEGGADVRCKAMVTSVTNRTVSLQEKNTHIETTTGAGTGSDSRTDSTIPYGLLVWAGGIAARPVTKTIAAATGSPLQVPDRGVSFVRGLAVDDKFRVKGQPVTLVDVEGTSGDVVSRCRSDRSVFALGDCALSGSPPTAQTAYQQGKYLGTMFRETYFTTAGIEGYEPFRLINYGALAYVGASKGVAELKTLLWDNHPSRDATGKLGGSGVETGSKNDNGTLVVEGSHAFALWRSLYFSKLLSNRNKSQVVFDWIKTSVFGRDISSPYCMDVTPIAAVSDVKKRSKG